VSGSWLSPGNARRRSDHGSDMLGRWFREPLTPEQPKNQAAQITRSRVITHTSGNRAERHFALTSTRLSIRERAPSIGGCYGV
jgi:hypothetical protein